MSTFKVSIEKVKNVQAHSNADRLDIATLKGIDFSFVVAKDTLKSGDLVVYFPIDSLLPMWIVETMGLVGKLSHGKVPTDNTERLQNRVKTVKLRGEISQGVMARPSDLYIPDKLIFEGSDLTDYLEVEKYEAPVIVSSAGNLVRLPEGVAVYDIEGFERHPDVFELLLNQRVFITEKVEGSNFAVYYDGKKPIVCQRNYAIEPIEGKFHDWWKVYYRNFAPVIDDIFHFYDYDYKSRGETIKWIVVRGEMVGPGIQGNYYKTFDHTVLVFDIEINGKPLDYDDFMNLCAALLIKIVPFLGVGTLREMLDGKTIKEFSNGRSLLLNDALREGIVVKPVVEQVHPEIGRLFLKQRSPEYLAKTDN